MENDLENTLQKLQLGQENNIEELNRVRTKKLREDTFRGIIMRTKAKWNVEGERSSKYFCNLEKRHFAEKAIPKLILDNGFEITNQDDILIQQHIFYQAYTRGYLSVSPRQGVITCLPKEERSKFYLKKLAPYIITKCGLHNLCFCYCRGGSSGGAPGARPPP
jgi:hypothetical protein